MAGESAYQSPEFLTQWCWARAVEWKSLPAFLSVVYAPVLFILMPTWQVVLLVAVLNFIWGMASRSFVSPGLSHLVMWLFRLKWLTVPVGVYFLFQQGRYLTMALCLLWFILAGLLPSPGEVGEIQSRLFNEVYKDGELNGAL